MPRFFLEGLSGEEITLYGEDARHIVKSLRMREGEELTLCDMRGFDYRCVIRAMDTDAVRVEVVERLPSKGDPACKIRLYQAMPKGDKLELIAQKATELGVHEIVPVVSDRCISRPNARGMDKKQQRLQKIAYEAAKQCHRGSIPHIMGVQSFSQAVQGMKEAELGILFYEEETRPLREVLGERRPQTLSIMVGCEGGFAGREAQLAREQGIATASLGARILRCETAPICALSAILYHLGEF